MTPRLRPLVAAALALLAVAATAVADGKFFGPERAVSPTIPDQRALIVWDLTHETLVIDTAVNGDATDLAWIVPVPAVPEITEVGPGLFPTLE
ncbi:MAG: DUF2330 domain-containing protein, partial [Phycisphaerales bacterium]|nr:DUF2330 domain-containing protein [Phycisphaerales bacterium]